MLWGCKYNLICLVLTILLDGKQQQQSLHLGSIGNNSSRGFFHQYIWEILRYLMLVNIWHFLKYNGQNSSSFQFLIFPWQYVHVMIQAYGNSTGNFGYTLNIIIVPFDSQMCAVMSYACLICIRCVSRFRFYVLFSPVCYQAIQQWSERVYFSSKIPKCSFQFSIWSYHNLYYKAECLVMQSSISGVNGPPCLEGLSAYIPTWWWNWMASDWHSWHTMGLCQVVNTILFAL